jgi:hypothetical protein
VRSSAPSATALADIADARTVARLIGRAAIPLCSRYDTIELQNV